MALRAPACCSCAMPVSDDATVNWRRPGRIHRPAGRLDLKSRLRNRPVHSSIHDQLTEGWGRSSPLRVHSMYRTVSTSQHEPQAAFVVDDQRPLVVLRFVQSYAKTPVYPDTYLTKPAKLPAGSLRVAHGTPEERRTEELALACLTQGIRDCFRLDQLHRRRESSWGAVRPAPGRPESV
jgi:hypothetical protein